MRARCRTQRDPPVRLADELRHHSREARRDTGAFGRQARIRCGCANRDPTGAWLVRQDKVTEELPSRRDVTNAPRPAPTRAGWRFASAYSNDGPPLARALVGAEK